MPIMLTTGTNYALHRGPITLEAYLRASQRIPSHKPKRSRHYGRDTVSNRSTQDSTGLAKPLWQTSEARPDAERENCIGRPTITTQNSPAQDRHQGGDNVSGFLPTGHKDESVPPMISQSTAVQSDDQSIQIHLIPNEPRQPTHTSTKSTSGFRVRKRKRRLPTNQLVLISATSDYGLDNTALHDVLYSASDDADSIEDSQEPLPRRVKMPSSKVSSHRTARFSSQSRCFKVAKPSTQANVYLAGYRFPQKVARHEREPQKRENGADGFVGSERSIPQKRPKPTFRKTVRGGNLLGLCLVHQKLPLSCFSEGRHTLHLVTSLPEDKSTEISRNPMTQDVPGAGAQKVCSTSYEGLQIRARRTQRQENLELVNINGRGANGMVSPFSRKKLEKLKFDDGVYDRLSSVAAPPMPLSETDSEGTERDENELSETESVYSDEVDDHESLRSQTPVGHIHRHCTSDDNIDILNGGDLEGQSPLGPAVSVHRTATRDFDSHTCRQITSKYDDLLAHPGQASRMKQKGEWNEAGDEIYDDGSSDNAIQNSYPLSGQLTPIRSARTDLYLRQTFSMLQADTPRGLVETALEHSSFAKATQPLVSTKYERCQRPRTSPTCVHRERNSANTDEDVLLDSKSSYWSTPAIGLGLLQIKTWPKMGQLQEIHGAALGSPKLLEFSARSTSHKFGTTLESALKTPTPSIPFIPPPFIREGK
ncbi:hypothetical protein K432DRAFT_445910 [Lepidopterella palustris CBS 459.81]|uniref:Uncharacterized protein n=1 Tax=Lepidopterella palustris CBS 459.81 TaxID=1314670 RepID=A0A8E2E3F2_9PEZI|nr:hypothetical protein K432DRAFT_445910 [Lepidopterella palustris CBS 459.81]